MKLKFDSELEFQKEAIAAVTDLFEGLPSAHGGIEVKLAPPQIALGPDFEPAQGYLGITDLGVGNAAMLDPVHLLKNLHEVQERNTIPKARFLFEEGNSYEFPNFSVEMETGTGKTYVYLRTIFELSRQYGYKKFIVVAPSVAIREGVLKSIDMTREHFRGLYDNAPFDHFVYRSDDLSKVRQFAVSNEIQIMQIGCGCRSFAATS